MSEREGDEILELLVKHEKKDAEENREKKAEEKCAKWEDRQRLERQGDDIMEMVRRYEEEEEEKRRQAEGMSAGDEYRMMLVMAERHAREMSEHKETVEEEIQKRRREARKKVVEGMEEMIEGSRESDIWE